MTALRDIREIRKVAVIDDDRFNADVIAEIVNDAGYEAVVFATNGRVYDQAAALRDELFGSVQAAVCDHRLQHTGFAHFYGAELVAELTMNRMPALLVTQYYNVDDDVSIRRWRRFIPVLLGRDAADAANIQEGFGECIKELSGDVDPRRVPWRALLRVDGLSDESQERVLEVVIPAWNPLQAVRLPLALLPGEIKDAVREGTRLIAEVNLGAIDASELYFDKFRLSPEPRNDDLA